MENASTARRLRQRIIADFRDFRFTPGGFIRWTGIVIAAVLFAAVVTLYFLDWNQMRGPIGRYASYRTGRTVRIDGNLTVQLFRWQPHVEIGGLYIGNPGWVGTPQAASIRKAVAEFRLIPAIFGDWILPLVQLEQPQALLVRDASGRTNWDRNRSGPSAAWHIPPIRRFLVTDGHVEIDDRVRKLHYTGTISSREEAGGKRAAFLLNGTGALNGKNFLAEVHGGPLLNVDESRPYAFNADIHAGDTHALLDGHITHPFHLDQLDANITVTGGDLSDLYDLTGLALPRTPPYRVSGHLSRRDAIYDINSLAGVVGNSDLHGDVSVDASGAKPMLRGTLASRVLDFSDLGTVVGGGKNPPVPVAGLLPDTPLRTERLRQMDADVVYTADSIRSQDFPLRGLATHIVLADSVLTLKPLTFAFRSGKLSGSLRIDAKRDVPATALDARVTDLKVENFIKSADKAVSGTVEARAILSGRGNSVHKVAASASGTVTAVIPSGRIRHSLAEWMGINVLSALGLSLSGDQSDTGLRCAVVHFGAKDGVLTSQQFVFDTDPVRVDGNGNIDLGRETLNLRLQGKPKHFQLVRLRAPISVTGSLSHPDLGVDAKPLILQGAIGGGLAAINPLAAILAFIDPGLADDANCAGLIGAAAAQGAPVKGKS